MYWLTTASQEVSEKAEWVLIDDCSLLHLHTQAKAASGWAGVGDIDFL